MNEPLANAPSSSPATRSPFRIGRLMLKELRETLRDRRTIITLILMPLLVYPALSLVFKSFLLSGAIPLASDDPIQFQFVFDGNGTPEELQQTKYQFDQMMQFVEKRREEKKSSPETSLDQDKDSESNQPSPVSKFSKPEFKIANWNEHKWGMLNKEQDFQLEDVVEAAAFDVGLYFDISDRKPWRLGEIRLVSRDQGISQLAADYLQKMIKEINEFDLKQRLVSKNLPTSNVIDVQLDLVDDDPNASDSPVPLASIVPLILVLMTITGAVYPAIDLTAGERERGTLETLMAAPIPRFGILFSKFSAVLTVATLTAILNIIGMFATIWVFQLDKQLGTAIFTFGVMWKMLLLLVLFAAFFSAILLVVTSFAKSFKEAQVYLIPVILLSLGPGLLAMAPEMTISGPYAVCPMVNILILARDIINGTAEAIPAFVAIVSTVVYSFVAIGVAARIFGSDAMLYADSGSLMEVVKRPRRSTDVVPFDATLLCLILLLPASFLASGFLSRLPSENILFLQIRFVLMAVFLFLTFVVLPTLVAKHQRTVLASGFGLKWPPLTYLVAGLILGISLWPIVMSMTEAWHTVYGWVAGAEAQKEWQENLIELTKPHVERIRQVAWPLIAVTFCLVPAACEEWFFRGMLQRSFLKTMSPWKAILASGLLFGAFHMISTNSIAIDRFVPTASVGLILGWLAYKADSIWPGVILHSVHNAFVIFLGYFEKQLTEQPWFPEEGESIPSTWVLVAAAMVAVGLAIIFLSKRSESPKPEDFRKPDETQAT